jgi:hypothetical protein
MLKALKFKYGSDQEPEVLYFDHKQSSLLLILMSRMNVVKPSFQARIAPAYVYILLLDILHTNFPLSNHYIALQVSQHSL